MESELELRDRIGEPDDDALSLTDPWTDDEADTPLTLRSDSLRESDPLELGAEPAPDPEPTATRRVPMPKPPATIAETGLSELFLVGLLLKTMYKAGLEYPSAMTRALCLPARITDALIDRSKEWKLLETLGQEGGSVTAEMRYALTGKGRDWALEALDQSQWIGAAPVPLAHYVRQMEAQKIRGEILSEEMLQSVFSHMTMSDALMGEIGPAVNSGSSILLYGPPGNGKSSIAEAICEAFGDHVFIPHAVEIDQQIVTLYDPTVHMPVEQAEMGNGLRARMNCDARYMACKRPVVITGGELELEAMDLAWSTTARLYEAPVQWKASGGIFIVDDLGRQRNTPQELINRLIVPLERRIDFLRLQTGRKFEVPFDTVVVFSTNEAPSKLADGAALRRMRYKILVDKPEKDVFLTIFRNVAKKENMTLSEETIAFMLKELYADGKVEMHAFHPRFLTDQVQAICLYEGADAPAFTEDRLRRAWRNLMPKD